MKLARRALTFAALALIGGNAFAQAWPSKPIRIIVPYPAGGTSDILARALGPEITKALGQQVLVDNKPGATGNLGADMVAKSPADGYTLLLADIGSLAIAPSVFQQLAFDPVKDFAPVIMVAYSPHILAAHPSVPAKDAKELIALAKARPNPCIACVRVRPPTEHRVAFVDDNEQFLAFHVVAGPFHPFGSPVEQPHNEVRRIHRFARARDAFGFEAARVAHAGGVDQFHRPALERDLHADRVARGAGHFRHYRSLEARERVHERTFPRVRRSRDHDAPRVHEVPPDEVPQVREPVQRFGRARGVGFE